MSFLGNTVSYSSYDISDKSINFQNTEGFKKFLNTLSLEPIKNIKGTSDESSVSIVRFDDIYSQEIIEFSKGKFIVGVRYDKKTISKFKFEKGCKDLFDKMLEEGDTVTNHQTFAELKKAKDEDSKEERLTIEEHVCAELYKQADVKESLYHVIIDTENHIVFVEKSPISTWATRTIAELFGWALNEVSYIDPRLFSLENELSIISNMKEAKGLFFNWFYASTVGKCDNKSSVKVGGAINIEDLDVKIKISGKVENFINTYRNMSNTTKKITGVSFKVINTIKDEDGKDVEGTVMTFSLSNTDTCVHNLSARFYNPKNGIASALIDRHLSMMDLTEHLRKVSKSFYNIVSEHGRNGILDWIKSFESNDESKNEVKVDQAEKSPMSKEVLKGLERVVLAEKKKKKDLSGIYGRNTASIPVETINKDSIEKKVFDFLASVKKGERVSVSLVQRKLQLGYNTSAEVLKKAQEAGVLELTEMGFIKI